MTSEEYKSIIRNAMNLKGEFKIKQNVRYLGIVIEKEGEEETPRGTAIPSER